MLLFEENNPCDISFDLVKNIISRFFPKINSNEIRFHYHGTYNVFEVKKQFIFRFPDKHLFGSEGFNLIHREKENYELIRDFFSLEIPKFEFISSNPKIPFVGYKKIPGQSLSQLFSKIESKKKEMIANKLGEFLSELHSQEIFEKFSKKWNINFSPVTYRDYWSNYYQDFREKLFSRLSNEEKKWVTTLFDTFLEDPMNFRFTPKVAHGDFDTTNILVDENSFRVTGIIDFEDLRVWDPVVDLTFMDEGPEFINHILETYSHPLGSNFWQRREFIEKRTPLIYLKWGMEYEFSEMVEFGFKLLKYRMK